MSDEDEQCTLSQQVGGEEEDSFSEHTHIKGPNAGNTFTLENGEESYQESHRKMLRRFSPKVQVTDDVENAMLAPCETFDCERPWFVLLPDDKYRLRWEMFSKLWLVFSISMGW